MRMIFPKLLIVGLLLTLGACRNAPIESIEQAALKTSSTASLERVTTIIKREAGQRGWRISEEEPGAMTIKLIRGVGKWVTARVIYDTKTLTIRYLDSANLNYTVRDGQARIHPGFNRWIDQLKRSIVRSSSSV